MSLGISNTVLSRVLVVTPDYLGVQMAGPAIRAFEMAKVLSAHAAVRLVSSVGSDLKHPAFDVHFANESRLRADAAWADVIVFQGHILASYPWLGDDEHVLVADIYDPMHLEVLEQSRGMEAEERLGLALETVEILNAQIERADFMLCASEKQRDFWLGQLSGLSRINPRSYDPDPTLRSLLDVAPFGISDQPAEQTAHGIRGIVPGISTTDKVIIWGGGIYNWFDPITLIRAVGDVAVDHPDVRLYFLGVKHPNPNVPEMAVSLKARELAEELGLLDRIVFFNSGWVPYDDRANYLLDADLGVSTHLEHLETAFSFRTRILDYLWAGLPIVSTDGDTFAEIIRDNGLGRVVPPQDVDALRAALLEILYVPSQHETARANVRSFAERFRWSIVLEPLVRFCLDPKAAADRVAGVVSVRRGELRDRDTRIAGLETSLSWRLMRPMRAITGLRHRRLR